MSRRRDEYADDLEDDHEDQDHPTNDQNDYSSSRGGGGRNNGRKRMRSKFTDDVEEEDDYEEDGDDHDDYDYGGGRRGRRGKSSKRASVAGFFDEEAYVDEDGEEEEEEDGEDDFIVNERVDQHEEADARRMNRRPLLPREEEDDEDLARKIQERYARIRTEYDDGDDDDDATEVEQQALLPSVRDPKLWMVKCAIGHEREVAVCLMQKCIDKGSNLQIRSAIALDNLQNYIYIEADKEAHVKEACKGMRYIYTASKILLVPIKEMADVLTVESKEIKISEGTWVRLKIGTYKGDLAKVVEVDNESQRVTVKLIPRIDLQALANKLEGMEIQKNKDFTPRPRLMNVNEAREMHIPVKRGDYFEIINGMKFKDGFLYKSVSKKSISSQNIQPSFDEIDKFSQPNENGERDIDSMSTLLANRKKGHFVKGDRVIVIKGDLKNLKGQVEKVEDGSVHIKPILKELLTTLVVSEKHLCKYFEQGNHVKVVSGTQQGVTGTVLTVEGHLVNIISDTTKEVLHVFSDNVVESSEVRPVNNETVQVGGARLMTKPVSSSRVCQPRRPAHAPLHGGRHKGNSLVGTVMIRLGPYKGYKGRVLNVQGTLVRVELESQMKVVTVDRTHISSSVNVMNQYRNTNGSETPMHNPSRTPLRSCQTPMRDDTATPINRAWNPYAIVSSPS